MPANKGNTKQLIKNFFTGGLDGNADIEIRRWTLKTGQGAKLYVRLLKGGTDYGKNQKKAQSAV